GTELAEVAAQVALDEAGLADLRLDQRQQRPRCAHDIAGVEQNGLLGHGIPFRKGSRSTKGHPPEEDECRSFRLDSSLPPWGGRGVGMAPSLTGRGWGWVG